KNDQYRQSDRSLRGGDGKNEEHKHLPCVITRVARKRHEVEVDRQQQQLDAHQQQDQVAPVDENSRDAERKQDGGHGKIVLQADHRRFSEPILTIRTLSSGCTDTCFAMSCIFRPGLLRRVREMAATIASNSTTAASSNA